MESGEIVDTGAIKKQLFFFFNGITMRISCFMGEVLGGPSYLPSGKSPCDYTPGIGTTPGMTSQGMLVYNALVLSYSNFHALDTLMKLQEVGLLLGSSE